MSLLSRIHATLFPQQKPKREYESALAALNAGDLQPMQALAAEGLGDAWYALADAYQSGSHGAKDEVAITLAWQKAAASDTWLNNLSNMRSYANECWDRRRFLGIGAVPDYARLAEEWEAQHFPGYEREVELAWIYFCGVKGRRDPHTAWRWLAIGEARWGEREKELPSLSVRELKEQLQQQLKKRFLERALEEAKEAAQREFVEGK